MSEDLIYVYEDLNNPEIRGKLSQGGWADAVNLIDTPGDVSVLVLTCNDFKLSDIKELFHDSGYNFPDNLPLRVLHAPLRDYLNIPDNARAEIMKTVNGISNEIVSAIKKGKHVVVTCHAGLNRSGLCSALSLIKLGFTPADAVEIIRKGRGNNALGNGDFVEMILQYGIS